MCLDPEIYRLVKGHILSEVCLNCLQLQSTELEHKELVTGVA